MRIDRLLMLVTALFVLGAQGQEDSADNTGDQTPSQDEEQLITTDETPTQFVPKEKISPDQVISFPADI